MKVEKIEKWYTVHLKRYNFRTVCSHLEYPFDHYPSFEEIEECYKESMKVNPSNFRLSITITTQDIIRFTKDP